MTPLEEEETMLLGDRPMTRYVTGWNVTASGDVEAIYEDRPYETWAEYFSNHYKPFKVKLNDRS